MLGFVMPILLGVSGVSVQSSIVTEKVDLIEVNHFHDESGRLVLDQVIFYEWSDAHRRFHVRAWRMIRTPSQLPHLSPRSTGYECLWRDDQVLRRVEAPTMRETWTQVDPERSNRQFLPQDERDELAQPVSYSRRLGQ